MSKNEFLCTNFELKLLTLSETFFPIQRVTKISLEFNSTFYIANNKGSF